MRNIHDNLGVSNICFFEVATTFTPSLLLYVRALLILFGRNSQWTLPCRGFLGDYTWAAGSLENRRKVRSRESAVHFLAFLSADRQNYDMLNIFGVENFFSALLFQYFM